MNVAEYLDYVGDDWARGWLLRGDTDHNGVWMPHAFMWMCNGNAYEAQLLAQIMYWSDINVSEGTLRLSHMRGGHLWIVKTYEEWAEDIYFNSFATVRDAMKRLTDKGLVIKETHKSMFHDGNTALFVRLNWQVFGQKIREWGNKSRNTYPVNPEETPPVNPGNTTPGKTQSVNPGKTQSVNPGKTQSVNPIYTENTTENTPKTLDENVEIEKGLPRKLGNPFSISPETGAAEKTPNPNEKRVKEILAALALAKIRFPGTHFQKREVLVEDAIIEYGVREVKKAIQESEKENARWWSYVDTRLRAKRQVSDVLTGEDYISGKFADYIDH